MLMRIPDMLAHYASKQGIELVVLRRKTAEAPSFAQVFGTVGGTGIASRATDALLHR
jgi:hypothetical protein